MKNVVEEYGWKSVVGTHSLGYITPQVLRILDTLSVKRVCDVGSTMARWSLRCEKLGITLPALNTISRAWLFLIKKPSGHQLL